MGEYTSIKWWTDHDPHGIAFTGVVIYGPGTRHYLVKGRLHRFDGPAIVRRQQVEWYWHGQRISPTKGLARASRLGALLYA